MGRGELVALLDAAPGDLRTLHGTVRQWTHIGRQRTAVERANDANDGLRGTLLMAWDVSGGTRPETTESASRVWFEAPNRWRVEGDDNVLYLSDGDQRWEGFTTFVTERGDSPTLAESPLLAEWLLPGAMLGTFRLGDVSGVEQLGRRCLAATAEVRPVGQFDTMGITNALVHAGFDGCDHRFVVDAEHGFVVRHTALVDGEPCSIRELTQLVVDEPIDPARFQLTAGTQVQTRAEERGRMLRQAGVDPGDIDLADDAAVSQAMRMTHRPGAYDRASLDERVRHFVPWGSPPADAPAAEEAIRAAFRHYCAPSADGRDLVNVQAGEGLVAPFTLAGRRVPGATADNVSFAVDALQFMCPDEAVVWFSLEVDGRPSPLLRQRRGRAVRVGDRWLIEHGTIAELLTWAGVPVPLPPG